ncbi:DUF541 domain-containing protein [Allopusillimonas soli]|uniref:SIMPL domain-containing protein n=2 Tax=Allopusillimonas soli TaxID=659016 RepID=A0A853FCE7_9BURK|nr:SIMPL domain-containing protein [Allopusillimonas soli]TEA74307.1 DUF541 domain-containing protein [Allopusillimonas soli]
MFLSRRKCNWLLAMFLCAGAAMQPALAHDAHEHQKNKWPQAALQAQAVAEVAQDTVTITLATEISDASQAAVAQQLSKALDDVMAQAKAEGKDKVKASSGNYRIWPMSDKDGKISNWRGRAEIILKSTDFAAASDLASHLSDRMPIDNLDFSVSPQARSEKEAALLQQAAQAFKDRAQALATAFGYDRYDIRQIDLSGEGARYEVASAPQRMSFAAGAAAKVPLEAGTEKVIVSVNGSIFLRSDKK